MLPKSHRLPGSRIPIVLKNSKRTRTSAATLYYAKRKDGQAPTRISVLVPIRLSKKASVRNRTKRLLREAVHDTIDSIPSGFDMIVMSNVIAENKSIHDIAPDVEALLKKARLLTSA